jgi:hypothetical protein
MAAIYLHTNISLEGRRQNVWCRLRELVIRGLVRRGLWAGRGSVTIRAMLTRIVLGLVVVGVACGPKEGAETGGTSAATAGDETGGDATDSAGGSTSGAATASAGGSTSGAATDSGGAPGPEEACVAWCAFNVMCSDISPEYCAMTCAMDFARGIAPGACRDAYVAFYLCVGGVSSCDEADLEAACGELLAATETSCGG